MIYSIDSAYKVIKDRIIRTKNLASLEAAYDMEMLKVLYLYESNHKTQLRIDIDTTSLAK